MSLQSVPRSLPPPLDSVLAVERAEKAAKGSLVSASDHRTCGEILFRVGRLEDALHHLLLADEKEAALLKDPAGRTTDTTFLDFGRLFIDQDPNWRRFMQGRRSPSSIEATWLFLAMTQHQLKQPAEAKRWFQKATARLDQWARPPGGLTWQNTLELSLLRDEAQALLAGTPRK